MDRGDDEPPEDKAADHHESTSTTPTEPAKVRRMSPHHHGPEPDIPHGAAQWSIAHSVQLSQWIRSRRRPLANEPEGRSGAGWPSVITPIAAASSGSSEHAGQTGHAVDAEETGAKTLVNRRQ